MRAHDNQVDLVFTSELTDFRMGLSVAYCNLNVRFFEILSQSGSHCLSDFPRYTRKFSGNSPPPDVVVGRRHIALNDVECSKTSAELRSKLFGFACRLL